MENWRNYLTEVTQREELALIDFIVRSNDIEGYEVAREEVSESLAGIEQGYPLRYVTQNPHIYSHLAGIDSAKSGISSIEDILSIHRSMGQDALEAGAPGQLRTGGARSEHGVEYVSPEDIPSALNWWIQRNWQDPFEAHTVYELIHPFDDGNGRSGRVILAAMLDFNYSTVNNLIDKSYFSNLDKIGRNYQGEFWRAKK